MFEMVMNSAKLFFTGKLFKDTDKALRQLALATVIGVIAGVAVGLVGPAWLAAIVAGLVAGGLQPVLYKDLKYA